MINIDTQFNTLGPTEIHITELIDVAQKFNITCHRNVSRSYEWRQSRLHTFDEILILITTM